jgi:hypothetical protein
LFEESHPMEPRPSDFFDAEVKVIIRAVKKIAYHSTRARSARSKKMKTETQIHERDRGGKR